MYLAVEVPAMFRVGLDERKKPGTAVRETKIGSEAVPGKFDLTVEAAGRRPPGLLEHCMAGSQAANGCCWVGQSPIPG